MTGREAWMALVAATPRWLRWVVFLFKRSDQVRQPPSPAPAEPPPAPEPPQPEPPPPQPNRHARRSWERQRRRRDKFVEPKGPKPISIPRGPRKAPKPIEPQPSPDDDPKSAHLLIEGDDGTVYAESELYGVYNFRDTILDQLDRYWVYLRRMRKHDPDTYGFYRQVGAIVVPLATWHLEDGIRNEKPEMGPLPPLSPWWRKHRPMFGCVAYGISSRIEQEEMGRKKGDDEKYRCWVPKFMHFTKYSRPPPSVQACSGGDVYGMTVWWDRPFDPKFAKRMKGGSPQNYAVFISNDGSDVHVLPECKTRMLSVPTRKNGLDTFHIPQRRWAIPREFVSWAKQNNEDADRFLSRVFLDAAHCIEMSQYSMVRITVHHGDLTAIFGVEVKNIPYFFQDRDIELTDKGVKKRIFHIVRPHVRKDGRAVPMHFRGLNEFDWAGYRVKITVPGRDHLMVTDVDIGISDSYWLDKGEKGITMPQIGKEIVEWIDEGLFRRAAK